MKSPVLKVVSIIFMLLGCVSLGVVGVVVWAIIQATPPTGQEVQSAINIYRESQGVKPLEADYDLCNNIVDRYLKLTSDETMNVEGHPGFEDWANKKLSNGWQVVAEVFSPSPTLELIMKGWETSPGHNYAITNSEYTRFCSYVGNRGTVVVFGTPSKEK